MLRFSAERSRWVSAETWHPDQTGEWVGDQWQISFPYSDPRELIMDIMRHGSHVKVIEPASLKELVRKEHQLAANLE